MQITIYKSLENKKTIQMPDDEDLTEFKKWAEENKVWYCVSKTDIENNKIEST